MVVNDDFAQATADLQAIVSGQGAGLRAGRSEIQTLTQRLLG